MALMVISIVVITVALTLLFVSWKRDRAESTYEFLEQSRKIFGAVILILIAWTFLRSGNPWLIMVAVISISLATLYVVIEEPHKEVV